MGVINVVIVKYSVEWLNTLHQGATLKVVGESSIDASMKWPLLISMAGLWLLYAANVLIRARTEVLSREQVRVRVMRAFSVGRSVPVCVTVL